MKAVLGILAVTGLVCVGVAVWSYRTGYERGTTDVQAKWDAERAEIERAHAEEVMKARQREQALRTFADRLRAKHHADLQKIAADHTALVDSLRDRPERPSAGSVSDPSTSGSGDSPGCTGAQLYRNDAAFLAGLARDADRIRLALQQCQAQYNELRDKE